MGRKDYIKKEDIETIAFDFIQETFDKIITNFKNYIEPNKQTLKKVRKAEFKKHILDNFTFIINEFEKERLKY